MNVFIDSNILLDVLARRDLFYLDAAEIWALVERGKTRAFISAISFDNIYYIVKKDFSKSRAYKSVCILRDLFEIVSVDRQVIDQAVDADMKDFEDAIQYFCAVRCRARYLITRNKKDFPKQGPQSVSSEEFLDLPQIKRLSENTQS